MAKQEYEFEMVVVAERYYKNGWGVYQFKTETDLPHSEPLTNTTYLSTITGAMQELSVGKRYKATATLENGKYGYNYKAIVVSGLAPKTASESKKFLYSIISKNQADVLIAEYPTIVDDIMNDKDNVDFSKLKGIKEKTYEKIRLKIVQNFMIAPMLALLSPHGVTYQMIDKLCQTEKNPVLLKYKIEQDPYILLNVRGLGFKKVDAIALSLNPELKVSKARTLAFLKYYFDEIGNDEGHTWIDITRLEQDMSTFMLECVPVFKEILEEQRALSENTDELFLHIDEEHRSVGLQKRFLEEQFIYDKLYDMNNATKKVNPTQEQIEAGIKKSESAQGFNYSDEQLRIIENIVNGTGVQIITGFAGVGKTAITRAIVNIYKEAHANINACALSARASIVIQEATGHPSSTIHRMMGAGKESEHGFKNPLFLDILFIDEMSMVNASLVKWVLSALQNNVKVIFIGDGGQLPAIGYGNVLNDLIEIDDKRLCTVNKLTTIFRQAQDSGIITDANIIRKNEYPFPKPMSKIQHGVNKDMVYRMFSEKEDVHKLALRVYLKTLESTDVDDVVLLTPRKSGCQNSTEVFNEEIQKYLFDSTTPSIKYKDTKEFKLGAKVMQFQNNYSIDIMNGDIGYIREINEVSNTCLIRFNKSGQDIDVLYDSFGDPDNQIGWLEEIDLAYCQTVHKSQGSGYKKVIGVLDMAHYKLLDSTMLYTLITRAKEKCMLVTQPNAMNMCIRTSNATNKNNYLKYFKGRSKNVLYEPTFNTDVEDAMTDEDLFSGTGVSPIDFKKALEGTKKKQKDEFFLTEDILDIGADDLPF